MRYVPAETSWHGRVARPTPQESSVRAAPEHTSEKSVDPRYRCQQIAIPGTFLQRCTDLMSALRFKSSLQLLLLFHAAFESNAASRSDDDRFEAQAEMMDVKTQVKASVSPSNLLTPTTLQRSSASAVARHCHSCCVCVRCACVVP